MPRLGPIKRRDLISYLSDLGFEGPKSGGEHQFMCKGTLKVRIPNPHNGDISEDLLRRILKQASISRPDWEAL